jgi:hypothetical protein
MSFAFQFSLQFISQYNYFKIEASIYSLIIRFYEKLK